MIFAEWKPLDELVEKLKPYKKVLLAGCATCVAECSAGGEKEVEALAPLLRMALKKQGHTIEILTATLDKQCEWEFVEQLAEQAAEVDAMMSIACGIGVQAVDGVRRAPETVYRKVAAARSAVLASEAIPE
ncbi:MAG: hypothetical protein JSW59_01575 [Phycisphaerales bacterium]|nr:MAG: hypothetical protein JSW59_01575 [Phycisphaerales bacterium]